MGRKQYNVTDEVAYQWAERHRRGASFNKIGKEDGVDRRLVARIVKGLDKAKRLDEIASALRDVRAGYLRDHLELLERAANILLQITAPPSLRPSGSISYSVEEEMRKAVIRDRNLTIAGLQLPLQGMSGKEESIEIKDPQQLFQLSLAEHQAKRQTSSLVKDLNDHLPDLWPEIEEWEGIAKSYEACREEIAKAAKNKGIPQELLEPGIELGLQFLSELEQKEDLPRVPQKLVTASDVGMWLFRNGGTRENLDLLSHYRDLLEDKYSHLEDMLNPLQVRKALLERQCKHCPLA